jgi:hypothetical protein
MAMTLATNSSAYLSLGDRIPCGQLADFERDQAQVLAPDQAVVMG